MADEKLEGPKLKKMIKLGKKRTLNFAFCPGKQKGDHVLMIDLRKKPSKLAISARNESTGTRVANGTLDVKGKIVQLTCDKVVSNLAKTLKTYLRNQKLTVNVVVMDANGVELESDIEDLPADPEFDDDDAPDDQAADDEAGAAADQGGSADDSDDDRQPTAGDLANRLKAIQPGVAAVPGATGDKLKKAMAAAVSMIKAGDLVKAEQTIATLEAALARLKPADRPDDDDAAEQDATEQQDAKALIARANALKPAIGGSAHPARDKLLAALGGAAQKIKGGDLAGADAALTIIENAMQKTQGAAEPAQSPDAAKWATAQARLQPLVDSAMRQGRGDLDAINRAFNYAKELAESGAFDRALKAAGKVAELLKEAQAASATAAVSEAEDSIPADVVPYVRSRLAWIKTRDGLQKEMQTLKSAVDSATSDIEGLEDVPSQSGKLFDYLNDIDSQLEDTLEQLVQAPDGSERETLKSEARSIIADYRTVLDTPFFQAVDDNGFTKTNIRGAALASLENVSSALAS